MCLSRVASALLLDPLGGFLGLLGHDKVVSSLRAAALTLTGHSFCIIIGVAVRLAVDLGLHYEAGKGLEMTGPDSGPCSARAGVDLPLAGSDFGRSLNSSTSVPLVGAMDRAAPVVNENLVLILVELKK